MKYRRKAVPGSTYAFTVVTYGRQPLFKTPDTVQLLRQAFRHVKQKRPFYIDAIVILPDHLHCVWTLPSEDADFSTRWRLIKSHFSYHCPERYKQPQSSTHLKKNEQAIWQRRFWEHHIRDDRDYQNQIHYVHHNPVKHKLVQSPYDWPYSSIHRTP